MNTRRKINSITPKEGFENMFELLYSHNKDSRGNNNCSFLCESFYFDGKNVVFENSDVIKKITTILQISKKTLFNIITSELQNY